MSAFWNKDKKEDHDDYVPEHEPMDNQSEDDWNEPDVEQTPRISRIEYKKMQRTSESAKNSKDRKVVVKKGLSRLFFTYILPILIIYLAFISYQYVSGNIFVKLINTSYFWLFHILFLGIFIVVMYMAIAHMLMRFFKIWRYLGAVAWFGAVYFYITFLISHDARGPILAAAVLIVTGLFQLTNLNHRFKGAFILLGAFYGNYLTILSFPNVWLVLGIGGLLLLLEGKVSPIFIRKIITKIRRRKTCER
ncbi:hypothetical protein [Oceanobacillus rekensis]|uniref:hypothetical protein n=1 Tax=Oceanobacillus rekensis TaxID=937927 RepID=UPI000B42ECD7|nr:hypothetical protein [Oceanobacillus rekensis]